MVRSLLAQDIETAYYGRDAVLLHLCMDRADMLTALWIGTLQAFSELQDELNEDDE